MRPQELIRMLNANGWYEVKQTGSHIHFRHPEKLNTVIVPYHSSRELGTGLTYKLLKQAGLR